MDAQLRLAYSWIVQKEISLLSLDLFDTLLWRKVPQPKDLFIVLGKRLSQLGWLLPAVTPTIFAELRHSTESTLRIEKKRFLNSSEVTLFEIYEQLQKLFVSLTIHEMLAGASTGIYESDITPLVKLELALEQEFIQIDHSIVQLIQEAQKQNIPILLVSDTYFEKEHIDFLLTPFELQNAFKTYYLSSEYGCSKQSGLFSHLIDEQKIETSRILHIGDHPESDSIVPMKLGLKTIHYTPSHPYFQRICDREWSNDMSQRENLLDSHHGDFGLTSLRKKIFYHQDSASNHNHFQFFWRYGAQILGPILFGFVHWIYERCRVMKQERVFCLMREGRLYANLIKKMAPYYPEHQITAEELWISRTFISQASIAEGNRQELMNVMHAFLCECTIGVFCNALGISIDAISSWKKYQNVSLADSQLCKEFIVFLLKNAHLREQMIHFAQAKRDRFIRYLRTHIDLHQCHQMTIVDIGWSVSTQEAMQQMLKAVSIPLQLHGLYLGTTDKARLKLIKGVMSEGFLFQGGYPAYGKAYQKGCFVLEQVATAETGIGALTDINDEGHIITAPLEIPDEQKSQARWVQQGIFAFFDFLGSLIQSGTLKWSSESTALRNQLRSIFLRSMFYATQEEAEHFGPWYHEHGSLSHLVQPIGQDTYYEKYIQDMIPHAVFKESGLNWVSAYAAKKNKYLTLTAEAISLKRVPAHCFLSQDAFSCRFFLDTGKGFPKKANRHISLRSNPNRHFYTMVQLFSAKRSIQRLQVVLSFPNAFVRMKSLRLLFFRRSSSQPHEIILFEPESHAKIDFIANQRLDDNTFYCENSLQFIQVFESEGIYQVRAKLCCEMFNRPLA